jgi:hypothetical protein
MHTILQGSDTDAIKAQLDSLLTDVGVIDAETSALPSASDAWDSAARTITAMDTVIKAVQYGSDTMTGTSQFAKNVTISAVDRTKAFLRFSFRVSGTAIYITDCRVSGRFTATTTIRFERLTAAGAAYLEWFVVEFK